MNSLFCVLNVQPMNRCFANIKLRVRTCDIKENLFYYCIISSFSFHTFGDSVFLFTFILDGLFDNNCIKVDGVCIK